MMDTVTIVAVVGGAISIIATLIGAAVWVSSRIEVTTEKLDLTINHLNSTIGDLKQALQQAIDRLNSHEVRITLLEQSKEHDKEHNHSNRKV